MAVDRTFQKFLTGYMAAHGLNAAAVGHLAGVTEAGVCKWLRGMGPARVHRERIQQELETGAFRIGLLTASRAIGIEDSQEARESTLAWIQGTHAPELWRQLHALRQVHERAAKVAATAAAAVAKRPARTPEHAEVA